MSPEKYIHPDDVRHMVRLFAVIARSRQKASSRKIRIMHRDGSWRLFEIVIRNMLDTPGVKGIVANMHDITDRKVVEEELRSLYAELERKVAMRTEELENANRKLLAEIEERKEIEARLRLHGKYLSALHETTLSIMNRLNLPELLRDIIDKAAAMLNAQHGFVAILERDGSALVTQTGVGCFTARIGDRIHRGDGAAGIVWETGDLLAIERISLSPQLSWPGLESIGRSSNFPEDRDEVKGVIGLGGISATIRSTRTRLTFSPSSPSLRRSLSTTPCSIRIPFRAQRTEKGGRIPWAMNDKYRTIIDSIQEGNFEIDLEGRLVFFNNTLSTITGYTEEELQGLAYESFVVPAEREAAVKAVNKVYSTGSSISSIDFTMLRKNGDEISVEASISIIRDIKGNAMGLRGVMRDITRRKEFENSLKYLAHHDTLTDLPNRILFNDRLNQSLALANRSFFLVAVLFLDLDNFKQINDTLGHDVGDLLLREVAARLLKKIRSIDTVARFGGDEFIFLLPEIKNVSDAKRIVRRVHESFSDDFILRGNTVHVTASIGISFYPVDGSDGESLLKQADVALYRCKEGGKNGFRFYNEKMNK
jgi:diguanylate cyclase (GGDEF)-like protein/PAS domain S-box-containing protein